MKFIHLNKSKWKIYRIFKNVHFKFFIKIYNKFIIDAYNSFKLFNYFFKNYLHKIKNKINFNFLL